MLSAGVTVGYCADVGVKKASVVCEYARERGAHEPRDDEVNCDLPMPFSHFLISQAVAVLAYDALPIHCCNSASGTLRPCSGRI